MQENEISDEHLKTDLQQQEAVLVIVDMQPEFEASSEIATLSQVEELIALFAGTGYPIVILEYGNPDIMRQPHRLYCGITHQTLMAPLLSPNRYHKLAVVEKFCNDGSAFVLGTCAERNFRTDHFVVCGVNTDACVSATVHGLAVRRQRSQVSVIAAACNTPAANFSWNNFPKRSNIKIVRNAQAA